MKKSPKTLGMSVPPIQKPDPIDTARLLLDEISSRQAENGSLRRLALAIDTYIFATSDFAVVDYGKIENVDFEFPHKSDVTVRRKISRKYPELGYYWQALHSSFELSEQGEIAVGDAIDDLLDISKELREVMWLCEHHGRSEALAGLQFRHESHIWMHIWSLRVHIEEMLRE